MARPDRIKKIQLFWLMDLMPPCAFVRKTMPQTMTTTTIVRIAVARLELTPSMPTFENGCQRGKNRGTQCKPEPHDRLSSVFLVMHVFSV